MSIGIDYGLGQSNIDRETGIRFGVVSQHSVMSEALENLEPDYGEPHCPKCGHEAATYQTASSDDAHVCNRCQYVFGPEFAFPDEPLGLYLDDSDYKIVSCLDTDLMIIKSPYYTRAEFCSPCVPGAGNLDSPHPDGVKAYCLGHDWFENGAPYPVYSVKTNERVPYDP